MKSNKMTKSKNTSQFVIKCILIQVAILLLFVCVFYQSIPINANNCINKTIVIEDKEYVRAFNENKCYVICNGIKYEYANLGIFGEYSNFEFYKFIKTGELLDIVYVEKIGLFGKYNYIVGAKDDANVYLDFETLNNGKQTSFGIIIVVFCLYEVVFSAVFLSTVFINNNFKFLHRRKIKQ